MSTLLWLAIAQLAALLMGLGITSRCRFLRDSGWALLLAPVVGHAAFFLLSIRLCTSLMTGRSAALTAFAALGLLTILSIGPAKEAAERFLRSRDLLLLTLVCTLVQVLSCLPAIVVGIDTYNGYGNLDAWYYTMDSYLLRDLRFFDVVGPQPLQPNLHTIGTATRVGPQFSVILLDALVPVDELASYNLALASFVWLVPVSAGFVCREVLALDRRWTLLGVVLTGAHSSLQLVYCYQHLGHMFALAATPLAIATFYLAASRTRIGLGIQAGVLGASCFFAYWPTLPLYLGPTGLLTAWLLVTGRHDRRRVVGVASLVLLLVLASSPRVAAQNVLAVGESRRFVTRNDPVMMAFNPYLTEDVIPISTGLVDSGTLSALWHLWPPTQYAWAGLIVVLHLVAGSAMILVALFGVILELVRRRPFLPATMGVSLSLTLLVLAQEYGYGLYKLISWSHLPAVLAFLIGIQALRRGKRRLGRLGALCGTALVVTYILLNLRTSGYYASLALSSRTGRFVTLQNMSGNPDWHALEEWAERHTDGPILIGLHQHVAQHWASFRLRAARYAALVPQDALGAVTLEDQAHNRRLSLNPERAPLVHFRPDAIAQCRYLLDWAGSDDVTEGRIRASPLESNATFRLFRLDDVERLLSPYDGWYQLENNDPVTGRRAPFRWMKGRASLLLFRFPKRPVRLVLGARAGLGHATLERTVSFSRLGRSLGGGLIVGSGRLVSDPFVPSGDLETLDITVAERGRPLPRKWTLWNRWVQQDPRGLALGVHDVRVIETAEIAGRLRPTKRLYAPEEVREELVFSGLYSDDWLAPSFNLGLPAGSCRTVRITATYARLGPNDLPAQVTARVNEAAVAETAIDDYGRFAIDVPLGGAGNDGLDRIELSFNRSLEAETFHTPGQDQRSLSARLTSVEFLQCE